MTRRVPEAAPLVGIVLAFGVATFGALFASPDTYLSVAVVAALPLYGFTGYGVASSPDPATAIPPTPVLVAGLLAGVAALGYGLFAGVDPAFAVFAAFVVAAPPALYHAHYAAGESPLSTRAALAAAGLAAVGVLLLGVVTGDPVLGAVVATLVVLVALDYRAARGQALDDLVEFTAVSVCLAGAVLAVLYFTVTGEAATGVVVGAALLVVGGYFSL